MMSRGRQARRSRTRSRTPTRRRTVNPPSSGRTMRSSGNRGRSMSRSTSSMRSDSVRSRNISLYDLPSHNDLSVRNLGSVNVGKQTHVKKTVATYTYHNTSNWIFNSAQGYSCIDFPEVLLTRMMLIGDTSQNRFERYRIPDDLFQLNPFYVQPVTSLYPLGQGTETPKNDLIYIKRVETQLNLLSMTNLPQLAEIYFVTPNFDTSVNPIDFYNQVVASKNLTQGPAAHTGITATTDVAPGAELSYSWDANPFKHKEFARQWKLLKVVKVTLGAGDQYNVKITFNINKVINRITLTQSRQSHFLKGITVFPMVIGRAGLEALLTGSENNFASNSEVSYGRVRFGALNDTRIILGSLPQPRLSTNRLHQGILMETGLTARTFDADDDKVNIQAI